MRCGHAIVLIPFLQDETVTMTPVTLDLYDDGEHYMWFSANARALVPAATTKEEAVRRLKSRYIVLRVSPHLLAEEE